MHFGFALHSSKIDLWDIDLLGTDLDLLDTDIPSKHFVCLQDVLKTSSTYFVDVFNITIFRLPKCLQDAFKTSLQDEKFLRWRRFEDVFKTCLKDVFKASWRPTNLLSSDFLIQPLSYCSSSFSFYVHIGFWILRIV